MGQQSAAAFRKDPIYRGGAAVLLFVMASAFAAVWTICIKSTNGNFTYALDDPYIHLGIAKNFAFHGVWGVTQYGNASASSSPLWTALLALTLRFAGDSIYWPLGFGILFSALSGLFVYDQLVRRGLPVVVSGVVAAAIFIAGPLHVLPFSGMEHSLQIFLDLLFLFWLLDVFGRRSEPRDLLAAVGLPALMCLARYESVFLIVVPVCVGLWRREWRLALAIGLGPILGVGGFALFSHAMGMPSIPNSIMIKGNLPKTTAADFWSSIMVRLRALFQSESLTMSDLLMLAIASAWLLRLKGLRSFTTPLRTAMWTLIAACILHASLASFGWFFRYEAYLVVLLATVNVLAWWQMLSYKGVWDEVPVSKRIWVVTIALVCASQLLLARVFSFLQVRENLIIIVFLFLPIGLAALDRGPNTRGRLSRTLLIWYMPLAFFFMIQDRPLQAIDQAPKACADIYTQQIQTSRFVARYYPTGRIAVNDIGAVSYFSNIHLLDLYGLATDEVCRLKLKRQYGTEAIGRLIHSFHPDIVIAYPNWFVGDHKLPASLIPVAKLTIPPVTSAGGAIVEFYATKPIDAVRIKKELQEFQPSLPKVVIVDWFKLAMR